MTLMKPHGKALQNPLGFKALRALGDPDKKIVIGFHDRVNGCAHLACHRRASIPLIVDELVIGGSKLENITLLCCLGLQRKNTLEEWNWYQGKDIVERF